jgi:hypothetical protein
MKIWPCITVPSFWVKGVGLFIADTLVAPQRIIFPHSKSVPLTRARRDRFSAGAATPHRLRSA